MQITETSDQSTVRKKEEGQQAWFWLQSENKRKKFRKFLSISLEMNLKNSIETFNMKI